MACGFAVGIVVLKTGTLLKWLNMNRRIIQERSENSIVAE
jgi:hypothetical protein